MKKLILFTCLFVIMLLSCDYDDERTINEEKKQTIIHKGTCIDLSSTKTLDIWSYPVNGHAMRCEVWGAPNNSTFTSIKLKSRTTHYKLINGIFKTRNTSSVYAKIVGSNSFLYGGGASSDFNNNNNWYRASTNWIFLNQQPNYSGVCFSGESIHKVKIAGVWYEKVLKINDFW